MQRYLEPINHSYWIRYNSHKSSSMCQLNTETIEKGVHFAAYSKSWIMFDHLETRMMNAMIDHFRTWNSHISLLKKYNYHSQCHTKSIWKYYRMFVYTAMFILFDIKHCIKVP